MLRVHGRANSVNVQKVMWAIAELGLAHERLDAGGAFGGLDTEAFGRMNPNRKIPVLEDEGVVVFESNAIVRYLAARYGAGTLWPEDPAARAPADAWMDWQATALLGDMMIVFMQLIRTPEAERDGAAIAAAGGRVAATWAILDRHLEAVPFVAGAMFTMGDIPVGAICYRWLNLPLPRPALPHLEAWYGRLQARPPFRTHVMLPVT